MPGREITSSGPKPDAPPSGPSGISPDGLGNPNPVPPRGGFNTPPDHDPVNHPKHYASDARCSGCAEPIECIDVVRHLPFNLGNAIKYLWRAGKKDDVVQDLKKAIWYIEDQIAMIEGRKNPAVHRLAGSGIMTKDQLVADVTSIQETESNLEVSIRLNCEIDPKGTWSSLGYRFWCKTHEKAIQVSENVIPFTCKEV